jgi:hypothetical protein
MIAKGRINRMTVTSVFVVLLLGFSCDNEDKDHTPILTKEQMVKALTEIYLSEQRIIRLGLPRDSSEREFERVKKITFEKIGVPDSVFKKSFDYYMDRPKEIELIYTALVDSLNLMEQRIDPPKE